MDRIIYNYSSSSSYLRCSLTMVEALFPPVCISYFSDNKKNCWKCFPIYFHKTPLEADYMESLIPLSRDEHSPRINFLKISYWAENVAMSNVADMFYLYLYFNLFTFVYISSYLLLKNSIWNSKEYACALIINILYLPELCDYVIIFSFLSDRHLWSRALLDICLVNFLF